MKQINWDKLELVIFDVDGTLYNQSTLRRIMMRQLISYYILRPWRYKEVLILHHFRKEREKKAGFEGEDLQNQQYDWCVTKTNSSFNKIKEVVDKWIFNFPNKFLEQAMYPGVKEFFKDLEEKKILKAIYSDYDSDKKLIAMQLKADLIVSSTDTNINAFKPMPNGVDYILSTLKIKNKANCLFIGDRQELDGECAAIAGIPFILVDKERAKIDFYQSLSKNLV